MAIAAGGKKIDFSKKTIKDIKTGKVSTFKKTKKGVVIKKKKKPTARGRTGFVIEMTDTRTGETTVTSGFTGKESKAPIQQPQRTTQQLKQELQRLEKEKGLRPKIVEAKTGRVIDPGRFELDRRAQSKILNLRKQERLLRQEQVAEQQVKKVIDKTFNLEKEIGKVARFLTPKQQQTVFNSFFKTNDPELPFLTRRDIETLSAKNITDIAQQKKVLADIRRKQFEANKRIPLRIPGVSVTKIKNANKFTKLWSDKQVKSYILSNMISKPEWASKFIQTPSNLVKGSLKLQTPSEILGNVVDLQKKGLWSPKDGKEFKVSLKGLPKNIILGIGEALFEVLVKLPIEATKASFNYGRSLVKKAKSERTKAINILGDDILKVNKGLFNVRKFIQERPKETAIIVGLAISKGLKVASTEANRNPGKFFGKAVAHLLAVPERLALKGFKITGGLRFLEEAKFIGRQPKQVRPFVRQIIKGAKFQEKLSPTDVKKLNKINFNEVKELNKLEAKALEKTLKETDSFIFGSLPARTIAKGKTPIPKDVDLATKNKTEFFKKFINNLPKQAQKNYIVKGEKIITKDGRAILDVKGYSRLRPNQSIFSRGQLPIFEEISRNSISIRIKTALGKIKPGKKAILREAPLKVPTQKLVDIKGIKVVGFGEQTTRKALGTLQVIIEKEAKRAKDPSAFITSLKIQLEALKGTIPKSFISKPFKKFTAKKLENSIKVLESKQFSKLLNKQVPGLTKDFPILSKLEKVSKSKINQTVKQKIKSIKDKIKLKEKSKVKFKVRPSKIRPSKVRPSKIKPSKIRPSKVRPSKVRPSKVRPSKVRPSKVRPSKVRPSKVRPSKIKPSKIRPSKIRPSKIPRGKILIISKPPTKIRLPILNFDKKLPRGIRLKFNGVYKSKGKFKTLNLDLPLNKALAKISSLVDNTTIRSMKLKISGTTTIKDIKKPKILTKFKPKISKDRKVLTLVEKTKHTIDTKGEKRGLTISKALKQKFSKKSISKPKTTKKSNNVMKNKMKKLRSLRKI